MNSSIPSVSTPWGPASPSQLGPGPVEDVLTYRLALLLWKVYPPVVILLGTFGNVMSIVIMSRMTSEESTVNIFFIVIAVGDLMVLYSGMMMSSWLEITFDFRYITLSPVLHYVLKWWVAPASGTFVSWMLVSVSLQRVLAVVWPHLVSRICTRIRVGFLIGSVAVFFTCFYSHFLYCIQIVSPREGSEDPCMSGSSSSGYAWFLDNVFSFVDPVVFSVMPFTFLTVSNSVLVWKLITSTRQTHQRIAAVPNKQILKRSQANSSVTLTVLVVSLTFLVLTLPCALYFLMYNFKDQTSLTPEEAADVYLFHTLGFLLVDTNSAVNFYLYCLSGRRFRAEFKRITSCGKVKTMQGNLNESVSDLSTNYPKVYSLS
ncbi:hypothetical protein ACOMHN_038310 [Nucella lapillus]